MKKLLGLLLTLPILLTPTPAFAHAFGQKYTLPLPIWMYLYASGAAIVVSFVIIGWFVDQSKKDLTYPRKDISNLFLTGWTLNPWVKKIFQILSLIIFLTTVTAGIIGTQIPYQSLTPLMFWIFLLLGITYLVPILGDVWETINPFYLISELISKLLKRNTELNISFPKQLLYLPALLFYFGVILLELFFPEFGTNPKTLSFILILYTGIYILGSSLFGSTVWRTQGDFFSTFFKLLSFISPFEKINGKLYLRPPFIGLMNLQITTIPLLLFTLFMLSSTAYDGFHSTSTWGNLYLRYFYPHFTTLGDFGFQALQISILFVALLVFCSLYILTLLIMNHFVPAKNTLKELAFNFAPSLVPIALAYNIAHYYTLLLIQGQSIIPIIFNNIDYKTNVGIVGAQSVWYIQMSAIVIGHIAAVYLAHLIALRTYSSHKKALLSQLPMLGLMVIYTVTGLWILSQPSVWG